MLKEYEVEVNRTEYHTGHITVQAESEEEAEAIASSEDADYDDFNFKLDCSEHEVISVDEVKSICPKCKQNELRQPLVLNALSRREEHKYICAPCGEVEALEDMKNRK